MKLNYLKSRTMSIVMPILILILAFAGCSQKTLLPTEHKKEYAKRGVIDEDAVLIELFVKDAPRKAGDAGTLEISLLPKLDFQEVVLDISIAGSAKLDDVRSLSSLPPDKSFLPKLAINEHWQKKIKALKAHSLQVIRLPFHLTGKGYGYFMVKNLSPDGEPTDYTTTSVLYFLSLDNEAFFSTHSQQDLDVQKLEKDMTHEGKSKEEIQYEIKKLKRSGAKIEKASKAGVRKSDSQEDEGPFNSITVEGHIMFTDVLGATHPVRFSTVQIFDQEAVPPDELVITTQTDDTGFYTVTINDNDGDGTGRDIYVIVQADGDTVQVEDYGVNNNVATGLIWELDSLPAIVDVPDGTTQIIDITATNNVGSPQNVAFEAYEAVNCLSRYLQELWEPLPAKVIVRYPRPAGGAAYNSANSWIRLPAANIHDWDVMHHEYGHHIQKLYNIANNPGGPHASCNNDCIAQGNKDLGVRIAWAESWPTFFGIMAQNEMGLAALGIPNLGDVSYTSGALNYSLEAEADGCNNGEACERALMRVLWDLYDNVNDDQDQDVALGAQALWDVIVDNQPHTFSAFWNALIFGRTEAEKVSYGRICRRYGVSVEPSAPPDGQVYAGGAAPTFQWNVPVSCDTGGNMRYSVKFFNDAITSLIYESPWQNPASFTPSNEQLNQIFVGPDGDIRWLVVSQDQSAPQTGNYYGLDRIVVDNFDVPDRNPVDIVLALDISGSMNASVPGSALELQKLKLLKQATEIFLRTWAMHAIPGDRIGVLYFTTNISSFPDGAPALLDVAANVDDVIVNINTKAPQSCTAIGGAIQNGYELLTDGDNKKVIILFTDGEQTHNPFVDEEGSPAKLKIRQIPSGSDVPFDGYWCSGSNAALDPSGNPIVPDGQFLDEHGIQIHTIGVGVDGADFEELINRISSETSALHHYTSAPDEELDIFFTNDLINSLKTGSLEIVKTQKGSLSKGGSSSISVPVNSASTSLTLVVSWKGELNPNALQIAVRAPDGTSVTPTNVSQGNFFSILKYNFPLSAGKAPSPFGNWSIDLSNQGRMDTLLYQFTAIVDERCFHYHFDFPRKNYGAGDSILLTATLTQNGKPLPKFADVMVNVVSPVTCPGNVIAEFLPQTKITHDVKASRVKDRELDRPLQQAVASLLQSNPKVASRLRAKTSSSIRLYDDGKKEHGDVRASDGIYSNLLRATQVAGLYQFRFKVLASTKCGRLERAETTCTLVAVNSFAPELSHISCRALKGNLYAVTFRPQDRFGNLLGAGKAGAIQILTSKGALRGAIVDNWDGSYQQIIEVSLDQKPHVVVLVKRKPFVSTSLSSLVKRQIFIKD